MRVCPNVLLHVLRLLHSVRVFGVGTGDEDC